MKKLISLFVTVGIAVNLSVGHAYDLSPKGTRLDRKIVEKWSGFLDKYLSRVADKGLAKFKESVHEEITHRVYDCNHEGRDICGDPDAEFASPYVIAGVRWNDDPPFQLKSDQARSLDCKIETNEKNPITIRFITQPVCWAELFLSAKKTAKENPKARFDQESGAALPLRSHFGDLQFIHSMASEDGEDPYVTRDRILGWAEFTWGIVTGDYKLEKWVSEIDVPIIKQVFGKSGWRIQELFTLGDPSLRNYIADVAFGSLLHMIQDSFAGGHAQRLEPASGEKCFGSNFRKPGPIVEFHSYVGQDSDNHAKADSRNAFIKNRLTPDAVDVGRVLVDMRSSSTKWVDVKKYMMCVYDLAPNARKSSSGRF